MPGGIWSVIGMLVSAVLILFLAYFATRWIAERGLRVQGRTAEGGGGRLTVLSRLAVGQRESLLVVALGDKCYLLGVTEHSITLLRELDEEASAVWLREAEPSAPPSFLEVLRESRNKGK